MTESSNEPTFVEPAPQGRSKRSFGNGKPYYTPDQMAKRLARLDQEGRRCGADGGQCVNGATRSLTVVELDLTTRQPHAERGTPREVKVCSRHRVIFARGERYQVDNEIRIGPTADNPPEQ